MFGQHLPAVGVLEVQAKFVDDLNRLTHPLIPAVIADGGLDVFSQLPPVRHALAGWAQFTTLLTLNFCHEVPSFLFNSVSGADLNWIAVVMIHAIISQLSLLTKGIGCNSYRKISGGKDGIFASD